MQNLIALVLLVVLLLASGAQSASYLRIGGDVVDPIQSNGGGDLAYAGANLEPLAGLADANLRNANLRNANLYGANLPYANLGYADLSNADLSNADLTDADLSNADLSYVWLPEADLTNANLSYANLSYAYMDHASLEGANLEIANLSESFYLGTTTGSPYYSAETDFTNAWAELPGGSLFDPVAAGWIFVPEPTSVLLQLTAPLTLAGLRRRAPRP